MPGRGTTAPEFSPASAVPTPTERLVSIRPDEPRETINVANDPSLFHWDDEARRAIFVGIPIEPAPTLEPEPAEKSQSVSDLLLSKLDDMAASPEQAIDVSQEQHAIVARIAGLTGTSLSVGFVTWALRSGTLLACCLSTMPAWRYVDPLPVLGLGRSERARRQKEAQVDRQREVAECGFRLPASSSSQTS